MTLGKWLRLIVAGVLGAVAAGSFVITGYLARLEAGIQQNVTAAQALVETQKAVRDRNAVLTDMVAVTNRMGAGLDVVLDRSQAIELGVQAVSEANRATLVLNRAAQQNNAASAQEMARVLAALKGMNRSASAIDDYLAALRDTVAADVDALSAIGSNTARMNVKTPGW